MKTLTKIPFHLPALGLRPLLMLLLLTLPAVVQAQFSYRINDGGGDGDTITITGYTGPGGVVVIPETINGLPVTSIGDSAFSGNTILTSVTIPNSVGYIGNEAFYRCTSLTNVTIPNSVGYISDRTFAYCTNLTSVTMPNSVTDIYDAAFAYCTSLTSVTIPDSVTDIGPAAFFGCTSLNSITIPNSVTKIWQGAFHSCTSLTSVTIGNGVTSVGLSAFFDCTSLSAITVDALNPAYSSVDGVLFNKSQTWLIQYPAGKAGGYTIPNSVIGIGYSAFAYCTSLTSVTIPNSVTSIGDSAFAYCTSLTSVTIPSSVTSISVAPFSSCTSLSAITVDALNSIYTSVEGVLFNKSQTWLIQYPGGKIGSYTIPNSVTFIGYSAFSSCTNLTAVTIPRSVTSIGSSAFSYCTSLTSVTIPNSVTFIDYGAFYSCANLTGVYFRGNTPGFNTGEEAFGVFSGATNATVYYLPGTTGWGPTFAGRPAVLWNPRVQTGAASFGVRTNRFGFTITGASNLVLVVEAATNLANPAWVPVGTNTLTGGASYFSDPEWTNHPVRFYRLRSP